MNRSIEVVITPTGEVKIDAVGFKGTDCEKATAFLEAALGIEQIRGIPDRVGIVSCRASYEGVFLGRSLKRAEIEVSTGNGRLLLALRATVKAPVAEKQMRLLVRRVA